MVAAYNDIVTVWKNADPELPILKQAKPEMGRRCTPMRTDRTSRGPTCFVTHFHHCGAAGQRRSELRDT